MIVIGDEKVTFHLHNTSFVCFRVHNMRIKSCILKIFHSRALFNLLYCIMKRLGLLFHKIRVLSLQSRKCFITRAEATKTNVCLLLSVSFSRIKKLSRINDAIWNELLEMKTFSSAVQAAPQQSHCFALLCIFV